MSGVDETLVTAGVKIKLALVHMKAGQKRSNMELELRRVVDRMTATEYNEYIKRIR